MVGTLKIWCVKLDGQEKEFWLFHKRSGAERYVVRVLIPSILRLDLIPEALTSKETLRKARVEAGKEKLFMEFLPQMIEAAGQNKFSRVIDLFKEYQTQLFLPHIVTVSKETVK